jgi:ubiquinone/menaquinone biosynthesis C-methylase UbiE
MKTNRIGDAYKASRDIYDDVLTQDNWLTKMYIRLFWGVDDWVIAKRVLDFIPDGFGGALLDVPVGTGVFTEATYRRLDTARIVCLDYSPDMLRRAHRRFAPMARDTVVCIRGDVGALPFENGAFDMLLSMNGFHAFPDKEKAFAETARTIRAGGIFIGCFYLRNEYAPSDVVVNAVLAKKGWFTPPFQSKGELERILQSHYAAVELFSEKAMAWFRCVK